MKTIILGLLFLTSCTKDWECCVTSETITTDPMFIQMNGTTVHCIDFRGTTQEKNDFEASGTQTTTIVPTVELKQITKCVID